MKKKITGILLAGMVLILAACSGTSGDSGTQTTDAADTATSGTTADSAQEATTAEEPARDPRIEDNYAGAWYASPEGIPMTLILRDDDTYLLGTGIVAEEEADALAEKAAAASGEDAEAQAGSWRFEDGFIFLDDDTEMPLDVRNDMLIWTAPDIFFTREAPYLYEEAALRTDLKSGDFDGYWTSAFVGLQGYTMSAEAIDDNTDVYIEGENVALGGDIFGDDTAKFTLTDGQLTYSDGTGAEKINITIGLQEDGYMRLVMNGGEGSEDEAITIYLSRIPSEEEIEQMEREMQEREAAEGATDDVGEGVSN